MESVSGLAQSIPSNTAASAEAGASRLITTGARGGSISMGDCNNIPEDDE